MRTGTLEIVLIVASVIPGILLFAGEWVGGNGQNRDGFPGDGSDDGGGGGDGDGDGSA